MPEPNVEIVRRCYAAIDTGNVEALRTLLHPEVELDASRDLVQPDVYRGHAGIGHFLLRLAEVWGEQLMEPERLLPVGDETVVAAIRLQGVGRTSGALTEGSQGHVWTLRERRAVGWRVHPSLEDAFASLGLAPPGDG